MSGPPLVIWYSIRLSGSKAVTVSSKLAGPTVTERTLPRPLGLSPVASTMRCILAPMIGPTELWSVSWANTVRRGAGKSWVMVMVCLAMALLETGGIQLVNLAGLAHGLLFPVDWGWIRG